MKNTTSEYIIDGWTKDEKDSNTTSLLTYDEKNNRYILEVYEEKNGNIITTILVNDILYALSDIIR